MHVSTFASIHNHLCASECPRARRRRPIMCEGGVPSLPRGVDPTSISTCHHMCNAGNVRLCSYACRRLYQRGAPSRSSLTMPSTVLLGQQHLEAIARWLLRHSPLPSMLVHRTTPPLAWPCRLRKRSPRSIPSTGLSKRTLLETAEVTRGRATIRVRVVTCSI